MTEISPRDARLADAFAAKVAAVVGLSRAWRGHLHQQLSDFSAPGADISDNARPGTARRPVRA
jgi:hypothetical protein